MSFTVSLVRGHLSDAPLNLLEDFLREGEPLPEPFVEQVRRAIENGDLEILAANEGYRVIGVVTLSYRLNFSAGALFASIEDLYVLPEERRRGVGRALLEETENRCITRGVSYVEVQVEGTEAEAFYTTLGYERESGTRVLSRSYTL